MNEAIGIFVKTVGKAMLYGLPLSFAGCCVGCVVGAIITKGDGGDKEQFIGGGIAFLLAIAVGIMVGIAKAVKKFNIYE
jgi:phosphate/sulfate permease